MKKLLFILFLSVFLFIIISCEGPIGPIGPEGTTDPKGPAGETLVLKISFL